MPQTNRETMFEEWIQCSTNLSITQMAMINLKNYDNSSHHIANNDSLEVVFLLFFFFLINRVVKEISYEILTIYSLQVFFSSSKLCHLLIFCMHSPPVND